MKREETIKYYRWSQLHIPCERACYLFGKQPNILPPDDTEKGIELHKACERQDWQRVKAEYKSRDIKLRPIFELGEFSDEQEGL